MINGTTLKWAPVARIWTGESVKYQEVKSYGYA